MTLDDLIENDHYTVQVLASFIQNTLTKEWVPQWHVEDVNSLQRSMHTNKGGELQEPNVAPHQVWHRRTAPSETRDARGVTRRVWCDGTGLLRLGIATHHGAGDAETHPQVPQITRYPRTTKNTQNSHRHDRTRHQLARQGTVLEPEAATVPFGCRSVFQVVRRHVDVSVCIRSPSSPPLYPPHLQQPSLCNDRT